MKKLHKRWLHGVIDASQDSAWRQRLFDSTPNEVFRIWACSTEGLPPNVVSAVRKYKLNYSVRVAAPNESEPWLSADGAVLFKFWATDFEELTCFTGNNPRVR